VVIVAVEVMMDACVVDTVSAMVDAMVGAAVDDTMGDTAVVYAVPAAAAVDAMPAAPAVHSLRKRRLAGKHPDQRQKQCDGSRAHGVRLPPPGRERGNQLLPGKGEQQFSCQIALPSVQS
jgi:hypothetical protein